MEIGIAIASNNPVARIEARELVLLRGARRVVDGASLSIAAGEVVVIQGESGSGKSTLLRALAGLIDVAQGTVQLEGVPAESIAMTVFRTRVAYLPQQPVMFEGNVADNLGAGPALRGITLAPDTVERLLVRVGLDPTLASRRARELSGGERQRVALARALANDPTVLLLDEPTTALDPASATRVLDLLRALAAEGLSVVVVTHQDEHARVLAGTRYVCALGQLARREEESP